MTNYLLGFIGDIINYPLLTYIGGYTEEIEISEQFCKLCKSPLVQLCQIEASHEIDLQRTFHVFHCLSEKCHKYSNGWTVIRYIKKKTENIKNNIKKIENIKNNEIIKNNDINIDWDNDWSSDDETLKELTKLYLKVKPNQGLEAAEIKSETARYNSKTVEIGPETAEKESKTAEREPETVENKYETATNESKTAEMESKTTIKEAETAVKGSETARYKSKTVEIGPETVENESKTAERESETVENKSETATNESKTARYNSKTVNRIQLWPKHQLDIHEETIFENYSHENSIYSRYM
eukprot:GHVL01015125.1.p1 GENE.GHVL01015125.1~~GHVL01015125.1.p1  ORF type:complete len:298 (-),score=103.93 GHVL01015125.1:609-1502(-)